MGESTGSDAWHCLGAARLWPQATLCLCSASFLPPPRVSGFTQPPLTPTKTSNLINSYSILYQYRESLSSAWDYRISPINNQPCEHNHVIPNTRPSAGGSAADSPRCSCTKYIDCSSRASTHPSWWLGEKERNSQHISQKSQRIPSIHLQRRIR